MKSKVASASRFIGIIMFLAGCSAAGTGQGPSSRNAISGMALPLSNTAASQMTTISLPRDIDPMARTFRVQHGTRVFVIPQYNVTYYLPGDPTHGFMGEVWGRNIKQTVSGNTMTVTNDTGYTWHFPATAVLSKTIPDLAFVAPGKVGPKVVQDLTPAAIAP